MASNNISVSELEEGMVLSADAHMSDGNVLLSAGTALTARHISLLEKRGIASVFIVDGDAPPEPAVGEDAAIAPIETIEDESPRVKLACAHLDTVFANVRGNELMDRLLGLAKERAANIRI